MVRMYSGDLGLLDLLPQAGDVDVDGARQRHLVVAPHLRQQRVARQRGAAVLDEVPQQLELARRQLHGSPAARDLRPPEVDDDVAETVGRRRPAARLDGRRRSSASSRAISSIVSNGLVR